MVLTMESKVDCAVLFVVFNRFETASKVFEQIRLAKPTRLYIAADGPRTIPGEKEACDSVRSLAKNVDWDCELHTLFRDTNLGCKIAVSSAISWLFENEEMGMILEDDCLPDPSFFQYSKTLLERYQEDERVMMITGTNFRRRMSKMNGDYYFSQYYPIWGWATWRRAWNLYDINMKGWPEVRLSGLLRERYGPFLGEILDEMLESTFESKINTWDCQWFLTCLKRDGLCITPRVNLISNIGFAGTHFDGNSNPMLNIPSSQLLLGNAIPETKKNLELDSYLFSSMYPNNVISDIRFLSRQVFQKFKMYWFQKIV